MFSKLLALFALNSISDCGKNPLFSIVSQDFQPTSPKVGDNVTWTIEFKVPDGLKVDNVTSVNSGVLNGFIPLDTTSSYLCPEVNCPVTSGTYTLENSLTWPDGVAGSKLALTSEWIDTDGNELLCSKVVVTGSQNLRG